MTQRNVLVLGGTGRTVRRPRDRGIQSSVASRRGRRAFLRDHRATGDSALRGASGAHVCYSPDLAFDGVAETSGVCAERARSRDTNRLVLFPGRGEDGARASEKAVGDTAAQWTINRSSRFARHFSEHFLLGPAVRGRLVLPAGDVTEPFIEFEELADIASAAPIGDGQAGTDQELTGPHLLTVHDVADELSAAAVRHIDYVPGTAAEFVSDVARGGVPHDDAQPLAELFESILDGRHASVASDAESALGRPATDFCCHARRTAANGIRNPRTGSRA